jgi:hypothetical protein
MASTSSAAMAAKPIRGRGPAVPPLSARAKIILAAIVESPGMTVAEIAMATGISDRSIYSVTTESLTYRDLVEIQRAPGRGNSLGAYVLRFYPTDKAKAGDGPPAFGA